MNKQKQIIAAILEATSIPQSVDLQFAFITSPMPSVYFETTEQARDKLLPLVQALAKSKEMQNELLVQMFLYGNFIEIEAEFRRQSSDITLSRDESYRVWQQIANAVVQLKYNEIFRIGRLKLVHSSQLKSYASRGITDEHIIAQMKNSLIANVPDFIDKQYVAENVSIIQCAGKVSPTPADVFFQVRPQIIDSFSDSEIALMDAIAQHYSTQAKQILLRAGVPGPKPLQAKVDHYSMILEMQIGASHEQQQIASNAVFIQKDVVLFEYICTQQPLFLYGIIPGAPTPRKVFALQDSRSEKAIMIAILNLAQDQLLIKQANTSVKTIASSMQELVQSKLSMGEINSQLVKGNNMASKFVNASHSNVREIYKNETGQIRNQGQGPLSLSEMINNKTQKEHSIILGAEESSLFTYLLSIAISCARIRFDAVQQTSSELVPQSDILHLYICRKMSKYIHDPLTAQSFSEIIETLIELMIAFNNDRLVSLSNGIDLKELADGKAFAEIEANQQLMTIKFFQDDAQTNGGQLQKVFQGALYSALAQQNREEQEIDERRNRRTIQINAINSLQ